MTFAAWREGAGGLVSWQGRGRGRHSPSAAWRRRSSRHRSRWAWSIVSAKPHRRRRLGMSSSSRPASRRWFQDGLITERDTLVVDEIHQTSAEMELCLALGKRARCRFIWLSATVDPSFYARYL